MRLPGGKQLAWWQLILLINGGLYAITTALTLVMDDPYTTVGVSPSATSKQIKRACRQRMKLVHPDKLRSADASATFNKLDMACELLLDKEQREEYDASPVWARYVEPIITPSVDSLQMGIMKSASADKGRALGLSTITSSFLHFNAFHLIFNCWRLWHFGEVVERRLGQRAFVATFVLGGALGNILFALADGRDHVGATAGIFALKGAAFAERRETMAATFCMDNLKLLATFALEVLVIEGCTQLMEGEDYNFMEGVQISYWMHLGGFVGGAIVMQIMMSIRRLRSGSKALYYVAGSVLLVSLLAFLQLHTNLTSSGPWALLRGLLPV